MLLCEVESFGHVLLFTSGVMKSEFTIIRGSKGWVSVSESGCVGEFDPYQSVVVFWTLIKG